MNSCLNHIDEFYMHLLSTNIRKFQKILAIEQRRYYVDRRVGRQIDEINIVYGVSHMKHEEHMYHNFWTYDVLKVGMIRLCVHTRNT